jgi:ribosomal protein S18 acetylase RimI-like enzyme
LPTDGVYWINSLYVSTELQGMGIGRIAMDQVEKMAVSEPLYARVLALDAIAKEELERPDLIAAYYARTPKVSYPIHDKDSKIVVTDYRLIDD